MDLDIRHYFDAVDFARYSETSQSNWKYSLGATIEEKTLSVLAKDITKTDVAIVGAPFDSRKEENNRSDAPDKIRKEIYQLAQFSNNLNLVDFGNLKPATSSKGNFHALRDIVELFREMEITTIIIGGSQDLTIGVCEAFNNNKLFSFSTIDAFLDLKKGVESYSSTNYLSRIFSSQPDLFQFNLIGYQHHYISPGYFSKTIGIGNHIRLGKLRDDISSTEPVFRNTDVLSFDIGAVKHSEAPGGCSFAPNGLYNEEACQLAKYAGLSNRLKVFGLFELDTEKDQHCLTTQLAAQIIWYFIEGFINRNNKLPDEDDNCVMYQVEVKYIDNPLIFYKNPETNQWWLQINSPDNKPNFIACTEKEYNQASNDEIPELWLNYIQKLDELLK
jgi:arginase family enzyme